MICSNLRRVFFSLAAIFAIGSLSTVGAQTTDQHQTLGSAPDVYRVEIRNLSLFKVLETGDSDGTGELDHISVELWAYSGDMPAGIRPQFDKYGIDQSMIFNRTRNAGAGSNPVDIKLDDFITIGGRARPVSERTLWIHSRRLNATNGEPVHVRLIVTASERDCAGNRNCNRGSAGTVTLDFVIPEFTTHPSQQCEASNTFKMQPVDDQLQIIGVSGATVITRSWNVQKAFIGLTRHKKGGVRLMPFNADICIASTKLP